MPKYPPGTHRLADVVQTVCHEGLAPTPRAVFVIDKSTRDRIVLLDPTLAPCFRRYIGSEDIHRYACAQSNKFLLTLPAGWTVATCNTPVAGVDAWHAIADKYPALARHLALHVADRPKSNTHWWELDAGVVVPPRDRAVLTMEWQRTILWVARMPTGYVSASAWIDCDADWLLGYLNSIPVQRHIQAARQANPRWTVCDIVDLPVPEVLVTDADMRALSEQNYHLHAQRLHLVQDGLLALTRAFAPLGALPTPALERWIELDFAGLCKAVSKAFKNDIPSRVQPEWQQWLELNRQAYSDVSQQISFVDGALTKEVSQQLPLPQG